MKAVKLHFTDFTDCTDLKNASEITPTLFFLHGTGGDHSSFAPQVHHFKKLARVVCMDLRGHGQSEVPAEGYQVEDFADDVMQLAARLKLKNVFLVGHSLGGLIALEVAARKASFLSGIVLIDTATLIPDAIASALAPLSEKFAGPDYSAALQTFANQFFFRSDDVSSQKLKILEDLAAFPQSVWVQIWNAVAAYATAQAAPLCETPALYVHASVPIDLDRLKVLYPQIQIEKVAGSGHFVQLERPEQINSLIETFIQSFTHPKSGMSRND